MSTLFKKLLPFIPIFILVLIGLFLRTYNLNWDDSHYLHPDERLYVNASNITLPINWQQFFSVDSPLNPHMYYYGEFPLFLYKIFFLLIQGSNFLITSRMLSALLSTATIPFIYFIGRKLFDKRMGFISAFVFTFSAGSIQHAHFITTESVLIFFLSWITYLGILLVEKKKVWLFASLGALTGMSFASKVTGATFAIIPALSFFMLLRKKRVIKVLLWTITGVVLAVIFGLILAPYQIIDYKTFTDQQTYMQGVILGNNKPPFVIIYEGTIPYIYQLVNILPFTFGFISLPFALAGLFLLCKGVIRNFKKEHLLLFLLVFPVLYFLWSGLWYSKFSRYYILLIPFLALWAGYALNKLAKPVLLFALCLIGINGLLFMRIYLEPNTRIAASEWIYKNIPQNSTLAGEHWDDNLPLPLANEAITFHMVQLTVYNPDTKDKIATLSQTLSSSDYFIISSRRVYQSILNNPKQYPYTTVFYDRLFKGKLGFSMIKSFTNYPFILSDDFADESFQSYDHPPVYIFKNMHTENAQEIDQALLHKS